MFLKIRLSSYFYLIRTFSILVMVMNLMESIYDIQQLLKKYGTFIYTGNRIGDLEIMAMELDELYKLQFIRNDDYLQAKLLLRKEIEALRKN
ncbi:MAG: YqgQ family protein [Bacillota bacterium]